MTNLRSDLRMLSGAGRWLAVLLVGVVVGLAAGKFVIDRPGNATAPTPLPDTYVIAQGTLSRSIGLPANGAWDVRGSIQTPAGGVITEVVWQSGYVSAGEVLFRINERPMVVIEGPIPAFRDLEEGSSGRDVAALQNYLTNLGHVIDNTTGLFTSSMTAAVREWQSDLGLPSTGVVALGDVVFLDSPFLATPLRWTEAVQVGASVGAGTPIVELLSSSPALEVEFGGSAPSQLEAGLQGVVTFPSGASRSVTLSSIHANLGRTWATLDPVNGSLCRPEECLTLVPAAGVTSVNVDFTLVPETSGPLVPVAAVQSDASGRAFVQMADGSRRTIDVVVASGGSAIIEGVTVGERILLP